jgi:hypothetical protein
MLTSYMFKKKKKLITLVERQWHLPRSLLRTLFFSEMENGASASPQSEATAFPLYGREVI